MLETALEKAKGELKRAIYNIMSNIFEEHEREGRVYKGGHHAARKIAYFAGRELVLRWKDDKKVNKGGY